jgi:GAF domain-containing protein
MGFARPDPTLAASGDSLRSPLVRDWLGTSLLALDGGRIGAIHLLNRSGGSFTALDEAIVVHLAQMAAAAVERARLHGASS